jgi:tyrosine-protein phosphatase 2/3
MSTPSMNTRTLPPSLSKGSLPQLGQAARSTPSLSKQSERTNGQKDESPTNRVAQTSALSFDFSNTSPFKLKSLVGGMSSDGEPPSRSQSPSADEATTYRLSLPPQPSIPVIPSYPMDGSSPEEQQTKTFDYKEPRPLHEDHTPPVLTTLGDPIWEVIQDMREQRMSLCQSLRQYVFVHAAIIEGALMVIDEEREIAEGLKPRTRSSKADQESSPTSPVFTDAQPPLRVQPTHPYSHEIASIASSSSMSIGKRGASPTELTKEDKEGDVMLSKRPSIKRKQRSGDDLLVDDARYHPVPARATPRALHAGVSSARAMPP